MIQWPFMIPGLQVAVAGTCLIPGPSWYDNGLFLFNFWSCISLSTTKSFTVNAGLIGIFVTNMFAMCPCICFLQSVELTGVIHSAIYQSTIDYHRQGKMPLRQHR